MDSTQFSRQLDGWQCLLKIPPASPIGRQAAYKALLSAPDTCSAPQALSLRPSGLAAQTGCDEGIGTLCWLPALEQQSMGQSVNCSVAALKQSALLRTASPTRWSRLLQSPDCQAKTKSPGKGCELP